MTLGIDFLCHECILIGRQRSENFNESQPSTITLKINVINNIVFPETDSSKTINPWYDSNSISNENMPTIYTATKVRDVDNNVSIEIYPPIL